MNSIQEEKKTTTGTATAVPHISSYTPAGVLKENKASSLNVKAGLIVFAKTEGQAEAIGKQVGTVDRMDGEHYIKLRNGDSTDGKHHWIPLGWVERTDDKVAHLNKTQEEFKRGQLNELPMTDGSKLAV